MGSGFLEALLRRAENDPDRVLFTIQTGDVARDLTQSGLVAAAWPWARAITAHGARPGAVVLIALPLGPDLLHAFLGALLAGCVPSFMPCPSPKQDPTLFWSSHNALFSRLGGGVIVTTTAHAEAVAIHITDAAMTVVTPNSTWGVSDAPMAVYPWASDAVACLQHSSGTTGLKKGVMLRFDQIDAQLESYAQVLALSAEDTIVSWLPLYHDMGFVACFLLPLARGNHAVLVDPFAWLVDPLVLFALVERYRGRFVWLPNFAFNHLVNAALDDDIRYDLGSIRAFIDCSERCVAESLSAFTARFRGWGLRENTLRTCYAMAETVFAVTQSPIGEDPTVVTLDRAALDAGSVCLAGAGRPDGSAVVASGRPLPGAEIAILDDGQAPVGPDRVGEIAIRAPFLFSGYHLEPERSAAVFHDGFYRTGDLGFVRDGELFVLGRRDDLLILLGRNVFANEIETILAAVPGLKPGRILAMGLPDAEMGSQTLVIVAERDGIGEDSAVRSAIRSHLESILGIVPRQIRFVDAGWLVKSTSGKIARGENRAKYLARQSDGSAGLALSQEGRTA